MLSKVYATEVSLEEYLAYTTEESEKIKVQAYSKKWGGDIKKELLNWQMTYAQVKFKQIKNMQHIRKTILMALFGTLLLTSAPVANAQTPIPILEIIKQGVIKVIKAIDLKIQRLQNKTIWLQNAKVLENKLSQLKLTEIAQWTEKQRQLCKKYYDELWQVRGRHLRPITELPSSCRAEADCSAIQVHLGNGQSGHTLYTIRD